MHTGGKPSTVGPGSVQLQLRPYTDVTHEVHSRVKKGDLTVFDEVYALQVPNTNGEILTGKQVYEKFQPDRFSLAGATLRTPGPDDQK